VAEGARINQSGRSNRAAALLTLRLRSAAIIAITPASAATASTPAATFEPAFTLWLTGLLGTALVILTLTLRFVARIPRLISAASASAAITTALIAPAAILAFASFGLRFWWFDGLPPEQALKPAEESARCRCGFRRTALHDLTRWRWTLESRIAARFAWFARLEWLWLARLERLGLALFK
jgi:hypothetical protein